MHVAVTSTAYRSLRPLLVLALVLGLSRCAAPRPAAPPAPATEAPPPSGPAYTTLFFDDGGLRLRDERTGTSTLLLAGASPAGSVVPAPTGDRLAFGYATADSTFLGLFDVPGNAVRVLHAAPQGTVYTAAWAPDGRALAFGFYAARRSSEGVEEMGPGGIRIAAGDTVRDVGCRAARAVEAWLPDGHLVVRDQRQWDRRTLYVVTTDGCADRARLDARTWHEITFSADGRWMAYLERSLAFNRRTRSYEPDTTLYVADAYGRNPRKVTDAAAHPRHLRWAPTGATLAFDRLGPDGTTRQLYFYEPADERLAMLSQTPAGDETNLVWSPSATNFVFDRRLGAQTYQKVARVFGGYRVVDEAASAAALARTWGWLDDERLVLLEKGRARIVHPANETADTLAVGRDLLYLIPR